MLVVVALETEPECALGLNKPTATNVNLPLLEIVSFAKTSKLLTTACPDEESGAAITTLSATV